MTNFHVSGRYVDLLTYIEMRCYNAKFNTRLYF